MSSRLLSVVAAAIILGAVFVQAAPVDVAVNGGFETGDFTGWTLFPSAPGNITIVTPGSGSTFAAFIDNTVAPSASLIKNANVGIGFVMPGDTITITFDARGSTAVGGVAFAEFFSELSGGGTSKSEILGGGPLALDPDPNTWTSFSFTTTAGPDVSGGVTLQLTATTGAAMGSEAHIYYDNIVISVDRLPLPTESSTWGGIKQLYK